MQDMARHLIPAPAGAYPDILRVLEQADMNTMFARSVLTQDTDGKVYQNRLHTPGAFYIVHQYGMSLLIGDCADEAFQQALTACFQRPHRNEYLQAYPDGWNAFLRGLAAQGLAAEHGRVNFEFDEAVYNAGEKQATYAASRTPVSVVAALEGAVVPKYFWKPALFPNCVAYTVFIGGEPASTAFTAYLHGDRLELGIETLPAYRGMGHAETACRALIRYCLDNGYTPMWSCSDQNPGSQALAQKIGFRPVRHSPYYYFLARESG